MAKFTVKYDRVLKKDYDFDFKLGNIKQVRGLGPCLFIIVYLI